MTATAQPSDGVGGPHRIAQTLREFLQKIVAGVVAEPVVDLLEMVEIHDQQAGGAMRAGRPVERLLKMLTEKPAIGESQRSS